MTTGSSLKEIRRDLNALASRILAAQFQRATKPWGGADVQIAKARPGPPNRDGFYPDKAYIVTPFPLELSWLFELLRDVFSPALDSFSKYQFFGRLGEAANRYQQKADSGTPNARDLLLAVAQEAAVMLREMEQSQSQP